MGYTVLAFNQTIHGKLDSKTHVNAAKILVGYLTRLTVVIGDEADKDFGFVFILYLFDLFPILIFFI